MKFIFYISLESTAPGQYSIYSHCLLMSHVVFTFQVSTTLKSSTFKIQIETFSPLSATTVSISIQATKVAY